MDALNSPAPPAQTPQHLGEQTVCRLASTRVHNPAVSTLPNSAPPHFSRTLTQTPADPRKPRAQPGLLASNTCRLPWKALRPARGTGQHAYMRPALPRRRALPMPRCSTTCVRARTHDNKCLHPPSPNQPRPRPAASACQPRWRSLRRPPARHPSCRTGPRPRPPPRRPPAHVRMYCAHACTPRRPPVAPRIPRRARPTRAVAPAWAAQLAFAAPPPEFTRVFFLSSCACQRYTHLNLPPAPASVCIPRQQAGNARLGPADQPPRDDSRVETARASQQRSPHVGAHGPRFMSLIAAKLLYSCTLHVEQTLAHHPTRPCPAHRGGAAAAPVGCPNEEFTGPRYSPRGKLESRAVRQTPCQRPLKQSASLGPQRGIQSTRFGSLRKPLPV